MPRRRWTCPTGWSAIWPSSARRRASPPRSRSRGCRCRRPRKRAVAAEPALLETALTGGDDYEIVCTMPPARRRASRPPRQRPESPVTEIGRIEAGEAPVSSVPTESRSASSKARSVIFELSRLQPDGTTKIAAATRMDEADAAATVHGRKREAPIAAAKRRQAARPALNRRFPTSPICARKAPRNVPHFAFEYGDAGAGNDGGIQPTGLRFDAVELVPRYGVMPTPAADRRRTVRPPLCGADRHCARWAGRRWSGPARTCCWRRRRSARACLIR